MPKTETVMVVDQIFPYPEKIFHSKPTGQAGCLWSVRFVVLLCRHRGSITRHPVANNCHSSCG